MNKKIIIWGIVLLILLEGVLGLGLRPAKTTIDFVPGLEKEFSFSVVNDDRINFDVKIYVEGELSNYTELEQTKLIFEEKEDSKKVNFKIKFPRTLPPGKVESNIVVEEILKGGDHNNEISAKIVLKHKLVVKNSYPEKFVKGKLDFEEEGDKIGLTAEVNNLGSEDIQKIKAKFYVSEEGGIISSTETEEESLKAGETKILKVKVPKKEVSYGEFDVLANIFYDGRELKLEKKLTLGEPEIEVIHFDKYFVGGEINKFTVDLLNKWNKKLENVSVDVLVFKEGKQVDTIKIPPFDMERGEHKKIEGYFDATNKVLGDYEFKVVVNYEGRKTDKRFEGSVLKEEEYNKRIESFGNLTYVLILILFGLIIILFGIYFGFVRKHKEESEFRKEKEGENKVEAKGVEKKAVKNKEEKGRVEKKEIWEETVFDRMKRENR